MKLADVYFVENNAMGDWAKIGYNAPNGSSGSSSQSTNFVYGASTFSATPTDGNSASWGAYNRVALNDCPVPNADVWTVKPTVTNGAVSWTAGVSVTACKDLTPNFEKIGK